MTLLPRHRFRFGLRTLFVLLTVVGCWLGWELNRVRARQAMLVRIGQVGSYAEDNQQEVAIFAEANPPEAKDIQIQNGDPFAFLGYRRLFGDRPCDWILFSKGALSPSEQEQIKKLFPEASIDEASGKVWGRGEPTMP